ncbi:hypothetical protein ZYGR_0BB00810 [Zygosaccharomyces rouxii]|uniref:RNA binding protein She2 domain-containing protein n=1 Tax=Zygosaccharomyces rouxii TaxID=4956 RepID=A0A1Q3AKS2_ZYGRO|nr:hypothetical protein ZYGR_0BB00810 [Zygosaccharomyces rouxii]
MRSRRTLQNKLYNVLASSKFRSQLFSESFVSVMLELTPEVLSILKEHTTVFSKYLSCYIHALNKFIGFLRKVSSLRFERTVLIKYVKKLRFINDSLTTYNFEAEFPDPSNTSLHEGVKPLASFFLKSIELLDLLNYFLTQPLQKEIISKTLNSDLNLSEECIVAIEDTYNHFVKFAQWMIESLQIENTFFQIEVVQFTRKCAIEDGVDLENTDNIFLQQVVPVADTEEYEVIAEEWAHILADKTVQLETKFNENVINWQNKFDKKKEDK